MSAAKPINPVSPEEFEAMKKDERFNYEFVDGIVLMSPSPSREHQKIGRRFIVLLDGLTKESSCEPYYELDIHFGEDTLKPDVMLFCDEEEEFPEIIIEILSPSTRQYDLRVKLRKYEEMRIKEYWIVDPKTKSMTVHDFVSGHTEIYTIDESIQSQNRPEIIIKVADIFA